jgi:hypothetical protein
MKLYMAQICWLIALGCRCSASYLSGDVLGLALEGIVWLTNRYLGSLGCCHHSRHPAEVVPEARLHKRARACVERLAGRAQHVMHDRRGDVGRVRAGGLALQALLLARGALAAAGRVVAAGAGALQYACCRRGRRWFGCCSIVHSTPI